MTRNASQVPTPSIAGLLAASALLLGASPALAGPQPNLSVSIQGPGTTPNVYASASYAVDVANSGNRDAAGVQLTIQLPKTGTSPQVYIMGNLGAYDGRCAPGGAPGTVAGTKLVCNLGTIRKGRSTSVSFNLALPEKTGALTIDAGATTLTLPETDPGNNSDSHVAALGYYAHGISTGTTYDVDHCTGTGLTAYFECTKFPGSISTHPTEFSGGPSSGTLSIPGEPDYDGTWSLSGPTLTLTYRQISTNQIIAEFSGRGVNTPGCFEGLTRFPDGLGGYSSAVAPYRFCP
jgi:hypothetical protein